MQIENNELLGKKIYMNMKSAAYWQDRAMKYGHLDDGLPAICSYGMPKVYNQAIHACQHRALSPWIHRCHDLDILDVGCGVGRWSTRLAQKNNRVCGVDISPRMIELATDRSKKLNIECEFKVSDVLSIWLEKQFDFILAVTVLQHIINESDLQTAFNNLARHLRRNGYLVLLEVAPNRANGRFDSAVFRARSFTTYQKCLAQAGFDVVNVTGVDIAPLRSLLFPHIQSMPDWFIRSVVTVSTLLSLPVDLVASQYLNNLCWHKVIVAKPRRSRL